MTARGWDPSQPSRHRAGPAVRQGCNNIVPEELIVSRGCPAGFLQRSYRGVRKGERGEKHKKPEILPLLFTYQASYDNFPFIVRPVAGMLRDNGTGKGTGEQGAGPVRAGCTPGPGTDRCGRSPVP